FTENGEDVAHFEAWVIDTKWNEIRATGESGVNQAVDRVLDKAMAAALVLEDIIQTYRHGYVRGEWNKALAHAKSGLSKDPHNPYLLRRAAEFSTYVGDFASATNFARSACKAPDTNVNASC